MQKVFEWEKKMFWKQWATGNFMNSHICCNLRMWTEPANTRIIFSVMKKMYVGNCAIFNISQVSRVFADYCEFQKPRKNLVSLNSRILEIYSSDKKCGLLLDLDILDYLIVSQQRWRPHCVRKFAKCIVEGSISYELLTV